MNLPKFSERDRKFLSSSSAKLHQRSLYNLSRANKVPRGHDFVRFASVILLVQSVTFAELSHMQRNIIARGGVPSVYVTGSVLQKGWEQSATRMLNIHCLSLDIYCNC